MYGTIFPSLDTLRTIVKAADFSGTAVGIAWLVYGDDYINHGVEEGEYLRCFGSERKLMKR